MRIVCFIWLLFFAGHILAQQEGLYTQYMYNKTGINAGYTGLREETSLFLQHRNQWSGLEGAPQTSTLGFETSFPSKNLGVGFAIQYDEIGPFIETQATLNIAYHLQVGETSYLSMGIKGIGNFIDFDYAMLSNYNNGDKYIEEDNNSDFQPDWGVGLLFNTPKYFCGVSAYNLLRNSYFRNSSDASLNYNALNEIHYYAIAGMVTRLNHSISIKPGVMATMTESSPLHVGLTANVMYQQIFVTGVSYQVKSAVSWLMGAYLTPGIFAGYSHDFDTTPLETTHKGTNEVFLRFNLNVHKRSDNKINLPRFF